MAIRLKVRTEGFYETRRSLEQKEHRAASVMRGISPLLIAYLRQGIAEHFATESGPDGPWQELAESTIARKGHSRILYETGRLLAGLIGPTADSIVEVRRMSLVFGIDLYRAFKHERGEGVPRRGFMPRGEQVDNFAARRSAEYVLGLPPGSLSGPIGFE